MRATHGKTLAATLMAMLSGNALASNEDVTYLFKMNVEGEVNVPEWITINYIYGSWTNTGSPYNCASWSPGTETVDWGSTFQQSRMCNQNQSRSNIPVMLNPVLGTTKNEEPVEESRTINVSQFQPATGTRDFISGERADNWSAWVDSGSHYDCSSWSPTADTVNLNSAFQQSRDCSQNQTRSRQVFNVWASGLETPKRIDNESQTLSEQETKQSTGTRDFIAGQRVGSWSTWSNDGTPHSCTTWTPSPDTVNLDANYTQSRNCSQDQTGSRNIYDVWESGQETLNTTEERTQTITVNQTQGATGSKDYITDSNHKGSWSGWSNDGGQHSCSSWGANTTTVDYGKSFTQTQSCKQNQKRSRTVYNQWHSGKLTARTTENDTQTVNITNSRAATGTRNYITGARSSDGPKTYVKTTCGSWSPSTGSVNLGTSYTQKRTCYKTYSRTTTTYDVWADGSSTQKSTSTSTFNDPSYTESKSATGTKDYVVDSNYKVHSHYTYTSWSCGSWSPSTSSVSKGTRFTQTRDCTRTRKKYNDIYNLYKSGKKVLKSSDVYHSSTTQEKTESRSATGTKSYTWRMQTSSLSCGSAVNQMSDYFGKSCTTPGSVVYVTEGERCPRGGNMQWALKCS